MINRAPWSVSNFGPHQRMVNMLPCFPMIHVPPNSLRLVNQPALFVERWPRTEQQTCGCKVVRGRGSARIDIRSARNQATNQNSFQTTAASRLSSGEEHDDDDDDVAFMKFQTRARSHGILISSTPDKNECAMTPEVAASCPNFALSELQHQSDIKESKSSTTICENDKVSADNVATTSAYASLRDETFINKCTDQVVGHGFLARRSSLLTDMNEGTFGHSEITIGCDILQSDMQLASFASDTTKDSDKDSMCVDCPFCCRMKMVNKHTQTEIKSDAKGTPLTVHMWTSTSDLIQKCEKSTSMESSDSLKNVDEQPEKKDKKNCNEVSPAKHVMFGLKVPHTNTIADLANCEPGSVHIKEKSPAANGQSLGFSVTSSSQSADNKQNEMLKDNDSCPSDDQSVQKQNLADISAVSEKFNFYKFLDKEVDTVPDSKAKVDDYLFGLKGLDFSNLQPVDKFSGTRKNTLNDENILVDEKRKIDSDFAHCDYSSGTDVTAIHLKEWPKTHQKNYHSKVVNRSNHLSSDSMDANIMLENDSSNMLFACLDDQLKPDESRSRSQSIGSISVGGSENPSVRREAVLVSIDSRRTSCAGSVNEAVSKTSQCSETVSVNLEGRNMYEVLVNQKMELPGNTQDSRSDSEKIVPRISVCENESVNSGESAAVSTAEVLDPVPIDKANAELEVIKKHVLMYYPGLVDNPSLLENTALQQLVLMSQERIRYGHFLEYVKQHCHQLLSPEMSPQPVLISASELAPVLSSQQITASPHLLSQQMLLTQPLSSQLMLQAQKSSSQQSLPQLLELQLPQPQLKQNDLLAAGIQYECGNLISKSGKCSVDFTTDCASVSETVPTDQSPIDPGFCMKYLPKAPSLDEPSAWLPSSVSTFAFNQTMFEENQPSLSSIYHTTSPFHSASKYVVNRPSETKKVGCLAAANSQLSCDSKPSVPASFSSHDVQTSLMASTSHHQNAVYSGSLAASSENVTHSVVLPLAMPYASDVKSKSLDATSIRSQLNQTSRTTDQSGQISSICKFSMLNHNKMRESSHSEFNDKINNMSSSEKLHFRDTNSSGIIRTGGGRGTRLKSQFVDSELVGNDKGKMPGNHYNVENIGNSVPHHESPVGLQRQDCAEDKFRTFKQSSFAPRMTKDGCMRPPSHISVDWKSSVGNNGHGHHRQWMRAGNAARVEEDWLDEVEDTSNTWVKDSLHYGPPKCRASSRVQPKYGIFENDD